MRSHHQIDCGIRVAIALLGAAPAALAQCWERAPAHGTGTSLSGTPSPITLWDLDGAGPATPTVVVADVYPSGRVYYWNGSAWVQLGGGFDDAVLEVETYLGQLYAAGQFTAVGGTLVNGIARWNGNAWVQVGTGLGVTQGTFGDSWITALHIGPSGLFYLGGKFYLPGTTTMGTCLAWNGASWVSTPQTFGGIGDFCTHGGQLYAATISGSGGVYRLDSSWTPIGYTSFSNHFPWVLASYQGSLYAGGEFSQLGGTTVNNIARWNGTNWTSFGGVTPYWYSGAVASMAEYNGELYVGGYFTHIDYQPRFGAARWNGIIWSAAPGLAGGSFGSPGVRGLQVWNGQLVAAGDFYRAGPEPVSLVARWNGEGWLPFVEGINAPVRAFLPSGTRIYAGGDFAFDWPSAGTINHVMRWEDPATINPLAAIGGSRGTNGRVNALQTYILNFTNSYLGIGGFFTAAGGVFASNSVSFDLTTTSGYSQTGGGFNSAVSAFAYYGGSLWAGGVFTASGANLLPHLAKYSAGQWVSPGAWSFPSIQALAVSAGKLIIGGVNGGQYGVSAWDGSVLTTYGVADGPVNALTTFGTDLVAAGAFTSIGGIGASRIAIRSSATGAWAPMGQGLSAGGVNALAVYKGELYAGGGFASSGAAPVYRLARWSGSSWVPVREGLDGPVYALAVQGGSLHIGGDFNKGYSNAPGAVSPYWIKYTNPVYANCDGSLSMPVLNVNDFTCFLQKYAAGDPYANCDGSTASPVLNVADFSCFLQKFTAGCP
jgi:trimeric autotransporter adhesin